ncbi:MAG TPA: 1,4-alpha-glucan branching protein domain-containing protein [Verrucomicrobiae bacterium]|nr:1,4-alpha-glucan branching protein domain-containing protein [Verrucomicrobiae bacterium]
MEGYFALVLHAHLPFVRHPEHPKFLEENWLFEAITETYIPLIQTMEGWLRDGMETHLTMSLSPPLCAMLLDPLLQTRYTGFIENLIELAEKETHRTYWDKPFHPLARMYFERFKKVHEIWLQYERNLITAFKKFQDAGILEIITCAATHALLPLLENHPESIRAQVLVGRDHYKSCFDVDPKGIWLPECAYVAGVEEVLKEANIRWFVTETHGILYARPQPRYGTYAPVFTANGVAAFGRDFDSAKQVWSRDEGYPGDPHYRDFYRDIAFDLDLDYLSPYLPATPQRTFTGIKYYRITGDEEKELYDRNTALQTAAGHAQHFLDSRVTQVKTAAEAMDRPPMILSPYDAELFGHWWYEGPEFLDYFFRKAVYDQNVVQVTTPAEYLKTHPTQQIARPSSSSWGEEGYWKVWLNETNAWIYPHLNIAQERMTELARRFPQASGLIERALKQAGRELLLAQASDWPFILRTGTSPEYAKRRVTDHLLRFIALHEQLTSTSIDENWLTTIEQIDNIFPEVDYRYWA